MYVCDYPVLVVVFGATYHLYLLLWVVPTMTSNYTFPTACPFLPIGLLLTPVALPMFDLLVTAGGPENQGV